MFLPGKHFTQKKRNLHFLKEILAKIRNLFGKDVNFGCVSRSKSECLLKRCLIIYFYVCIRPRISEIKAL